MKSKGIQAFTLQFLSDLQENNNRPWFNEHKERYVEAHGDMIEFAEALLNEMSHHDDLVQMSGKQSLHRIYRDTRFSKDKTPYKRNFSGSLKRATKWLRGGYYYHIEPGNSFVGGGFWGPNPADLKRIRQEIAYDDQPLRKIINAASFKKTFGELQGNGVKTAPKGYPKDHKAIDLLRKKQFIVLRSFDDDLVTSSKLLREMIKTFQQMRPFFDYMSEVLTTDANGIPIED